MKNIFKFQLGGLVNTIGNVNPVGAPQGLNPQVQSFGLNTTALNVQPFLQGQNLVERRRAGDLAQDRFDFQVQKDLLKLNNDFAESIATQNRGLRGIKQGNFNLNPAYARNQAALTRVYDFTEDAQNQLASLMSGANSNNLGQLGIEATRIRNNSQRRIELESGIMQESIIDQAFDQTIESIRSAKNSNKDTAVNAAALQRMIDQYEAYKNNLSPGASFDQSLLNPSLYIFNERQSLDRLDELTETVTKDITNTSVVAKGLGLPRGVVALVENTTQTDEAKAKQVLQTALEADPQIRNYLEAVGLTPQEYAERQVDARILPDRTNVEKVQDLRRRSTSSGGGRTAAQRNKDANRQDREGLLRDINQGNRVESLIGRKYNGNLISQAQYHRVFGGSGTPAITILLETKDEKGNPTTETEIISLGVGEGEGLEVVNNILNQGIPASRQVVSDELNEFFRSVNSTTETPTPSTTTPSTPSDRESLVNKYKK